MFRLRACARCRAAAYATCLRYALRYFADVAATRRHDAAAAAYATLPMPLRCLTPMPFCLLYSAMPRRCLRWRFAFVSAIHHAIYDTLYRFDDAIAATCFMPADAAAMAAPCRLRPCRFAYAFEPLFRSRLIKSRLHVATPFCRYLSFTPDSLMAADAAAAATRRCRYVAAFVALRRRHRFYDVFLLRAASA